MIQQSITKNDKKANWLIGIFSFVVFIVVTILTKTKVEVDLGFDVHVFAAMNALINGVVAVLLIAALWAVRKGKYTLHKNIMLGAMILSIFFLVTYIAHHLLAGEARFGDINGDDVVSAEEALAVGPIRYIYLFLLITHIILAALILPFILYTAYRGLTAEWPAHRKLAKYTWPLWLYVAITGPIIYFMISPYYQ